MSLECRRDSLPLELLELELLELELLELEPLLLAALHQRICAEHVLRVARKSGPRRALCIPTVTWQGSWQGVAAGHETYALKDASSHRLVSVVDHGGCL